MDDQQAIERYRYMLKTAPPEDVEGAHAEAFERLTPEQRRLVLTELSRGVPASEVGGDDPKSLARMATRAEMREPGTMERTFGNVQGPGMGGMFLSTLAGVFVGSAIADTFFGQDSSSDGEAGADGDTGADADGGGEPAGGDDFGGGDFGGGDFGGGDFGGI
ncbi:MAG: hypothetical protein ACR2GO_09985 [Candidatus Limnocylindria bacterium]